MALGLRVKKRRGELNLSQKQLASMVGVSQVAINNLEQRDSLSSRRSYALAEALETTVEWLEQGEGGHGSESVAQKRLSPLELKKMVLQLSAKERKELVKDLLDAFSE